MTLARFEQPLAIDPGKNPALVYMSGLSSKNSVQAVRTRLNQVAKFFRPGATAATFPWHQLRYEDLQRLRGHLADNVAPTTANNTLTFVRRVLRAAWKLGQLSGEELARVSDVERVPGESLPAGRALELDELRALLDAAGQDERRWRARRNRALIGVLCCAGLRRAEAVQLDLRDLVESEGRQRLRVLGKGHRERLVPLPQELRAVLDEWLAVRGLGPGPLFPARSRRGQVLRGDHMRPDSLYKIVRELVERAALKHASPHDFRRTFISNLLDESGDVSAIQKLAGHRDVTTTLRYDRRGERAKEAAVDRLPTPFGR